MLWVREGGKRGKGKGEREKGKELYRAGPKGRKAHGVAYHVRLQCVAYHVRVQKVELCLFFDFLYYAQRATRNA